MTEMLERQSVSLLDLMVFCPFSYRHVHFERCLECLRLVRTDANDPPRYIICGARMLDRGEARPT